MAIYKKGIWTGTGAPNKNYIADSSFSTRANAGIYVFNGDEVTFESNSFGASGISFSVPMDAAAKTDFKNQKITFSMEYKIDTALEFGTTNPWVGFEMSCSRNTTTGGSNQWLDWYGGRSIPTAVTNGWVYYSTTVTVTNYDIASVGLSIFMRDTKGKISYRHPKIEIGTVPTPWIPNEKDKLYIGETHGFLEVKDKVKIQEKGYIQANNFIEF